MNAFDFILNGGLFGTLRSFDHKQEGRPYGFREFQEDTSRVKESVAMLSSFTPLKSLESKMNK